MSWKTWSLIGITGTAVLAIVAAVATSPAANPPASAALSSASAPPTWDSGALSAAPASATVVYEADKYGAFDGRRFSGFVLEFDIENHTDRDITVPADAAIKRHLEPGGPLIDSSAFARLGTAVTVKANARARVGVNVNWACGRVDGHGDWHEVDPRGCYRDLWGGTSAWELFDSRNHLQVTLPRPPLR